MLRTAGITFAIVVGLLSAFSDGASAEAVRSEARGTRAGLDRDARELRKQAARLTGDLRLQSRQRSELRGLYEESTELFFLADHIDQLAGGPVDTVGIARDLDDLEQVLHQMTEIAAGLNRGPRIPPLREVSAHLQAIDDTVHHLQEHVAERRGVSQRIQSRPNERIQLQFKN